MSQSSLHWIFFLLWNTIFWKQWVIKNGKILVQYLLNSQKRNYLIFNGILNLLAVRFPDLFKEQLKNHPLTILFQFGMDWNDLKNNFQDKMWSNETEKYLKRFFQLKLLMEARLASRFLSFFLSHSLYLIHYLFSSSIELQLKKNPTKPNKSNNFAIKKTFAFHNFI